MRSVTTIGYPAPTPAEVVIDAIADPSNWPEWLRNLVIVLLCVVAVVLFMILWGFLVRLVRWAKGKKR